MKKFKSTIFYIAIFAILIVVASFLFSQSSSKAIKYSDLIELFESGQIRSFEINDNTLIYYTWEDNPDAAQEATKSAEYTLYSPTWFMDDVRESVETQLENGTMESYDLTPRAETPFWVSLIPYLLLAGLLIFFVLY